MAGEWAAANDRLRLTGPHNAGLSAFESLSSYSYRYLRISLRSPCTQLSRQRRTVEPRLLLNPVAWHPMQEVESAAPHGARH